MAYFLVIRSICNPLSEGGGWYWSFHSFSLNGTRMISLGLPALWPFVAIVCDVAFVQSNLIALSRMTSDTYYEICEASLRLIVF